MHKRDEVEWMDKRGALHSHSRKLIGEQLASRSNTSKAEIPTLSSPEYLKTPRYLVVLLA
jgi:hypothetical protein